MTADRWLMKRVLTTVLSVVLAGSGPAAGSSIATLPDRSDSPSTITLGSGFLPPIEPLPIYGAGGSQEPIMYVISSSIIAIGAAAIPVAGEQVASANGTAPASRARWMGESLPLVIRGGMIGHAASASAPTLAANTPPADQTARGTRSERARAPQAEEPQREGSQAAAPAPIAPEQPAAPVGTMR